MLDLPPRAELWQSSGASQLVYLAHDRTLGRDVAIKFLSPGRLPDTDARHALLREARAAAALDHPYLCAIYEAAETDDGRAFIVMQ